VSGDLVKRAVKIKVLRTVKFRFSSFPTTETGFKTHSFSPYQKTLLRYQIQHSLIENRITNLNWPNIVLYLAGLLCVLFWIWFIISQTHTKKYFTVFFTKEKSLLWTHSATNMKMKNEYGFICNRNLVSFNKFSYLGCLQAYVDPIAFMSKFLSFKVPLCSPSCELTTSFTSWFTLDLNMKGFSIIISELIVRLEC
jgi:hypothetical protein